ncbi:unnamed protein product [Mytilus edulis]|uniref:Uncharacterized protein n=1 Tax=Mytilus edulis TaxID=6550 RepID=A0A8S3UXM2_MYTED|nr:unnamed protein product [Mytilus edulis]
MHIVMFNTFRNSRRRKDDEQICFCADGYEGSIPSDCFTWKINKELEVELICKLSGANKDVNIYDSRNRYDFNCSYDKTCQAHSNEKHETTFTVTVADDYEGQWFCKHGKNRLSANISISKGYLPSTQLTLSGTRHEDKSYTLSCSTCWEIDGLSVEFLVNDKTNDSVRFDDKKCYHKNRSVFKVDARALQIVLTGHLKQMIDPTFIIFHVEYILQIVKGTV